MLEFIVKTGVVAGAMFVNGLINVGADKAINKAVKPKVPERKPEMSEQEYLELLAKEDKKGAIKKAVAKGTVRVLSTVGTAAGASVALGAVGGEASTEAGGDAE